MRIAKIYAVKKVKKFCDVRYSARPLALFVPHSEENIFVLSSIAYPFSVNADEFYFPWLVEAWQCWSGVRFPAQTFN